MLTPEEKYEITRLTANLWYVGRELNYVRSLLSEQQREQVRNWVDCSILKNFPQGFKTREEQIKWHKQQLMMLEQEEFELSLLRTQEDNPGYERFHNPITGQSETTLGRSDVYGRMVDRDE